MNFAEEQYLLWLWGLLPLVGLCLLALRLRRRRLAALAAFQNRLLNRQESRGRYVLKTGLLLLGVAAIVVALAKPRWGFDWQEVRSKGVDIMIAVDVSRSMLATDVKPSRLLRAKREIIDLLGMLQGDRVGLIAFAGAAYVQCPLTVDYGAARMFLDYLDTDLIPVGGTALGMAIELATKSLAEASPDSSKGRALIIITDGEDHDADTQAAVAAAKEAGVKIFTIGIGALEGAPVPSKEGGFTKDARGNVVLSKLNEDALRQVAAKAEGTYVRSVSGDMDLEQIYLNGIKTRLEGQEFEVQRRRLWHERFQWFIFIAFAGLLLEALLGYGRGGALLVLMALTEVFNGSSAYADPIDQAHRAYRARDYKGAEEKFLEAEIDHPDNFEHAYNRAVTQYRQRKFDQAREGFAKAAQSSDEGLAARSYFNLGNAEASAGNYEGAVAAYEEALKLRPDDKPTQENLAFVKQQKQEQEQDKQQQEDQKDNQKDNDQKNEDQQDQQRSNQKDKSDQPNSKPNKPDQPQQQDESKDQSAAQQRQQEQQKQKDSPQQSKQDQTQPSAGENAKADQNQAEPGGQPSGQKAGMSKGQAEQLLDSVEDQALKYMSRPQMEKGRARQGDKDW